MFRFLLLQRTARQKSGTVDPHHKNYIIFVFEESFPQKWRDLEEYIILDTKNFILLRELRKLWSFCKIRKKPPALVWFFSGCDFAVANLILGLLCRSEICPGFQKSHLENQPIKLNSRVKKLWFFFTNYSQYPSIQNELQKSSVQQ